VSGERQSPYALRIRHESVDHDDPQRRTGSWHALDAGQSAPYDGHTLAEALEQAAILSDLTPEIAVVDRGYKGVDIEGVKIYHPGLRRGITRGLRAMIRRRSAIEPAIGHMKTDGKLDRNWLKGALGDAMHAVLCGAGHNLRMILRKLRLFCVFVLAALLNRCNAAHVTA
jgi:IS5 family transposase